jgi:hypothetical protein
VEKEFFVGKPAVVVVVPPVGCDLKPGQRVQWRIESSSGAVCDPGYGLAAAASFHGRLVLEIRFRPIAPGDFEIKLRVGNHPTRVPVIYRVLPGLSTLDTRHDRESVSAIHDIEPPGIRFSQSNLGWFLLFAFAVLAAVSSLLFFVGWL